MSYPLHAAVVTGREGDVKKALEKGDVNALDDNNQSPLLLAVLANNPKLVKLLLKKGANSNQADANGWTPLHHSAKMSYFKIFEQLVRKGKAIVTLPTQDDKLENALGLLCRNDAFNPAPLLKAVKCLLTAQGHVNVPNADQNMPLHFACDTGTREVVALLLQNGADVAAVNNLGETALHLAVRKGRADVVSLLLENGAPVLIRTKAGLTPAEEAKAQNFSSLESVLNERMKDIVGRFFHMNLRTPKMKQPPMRHNHTTTLHGNKIYVVGGCDTLNMGEAKVFHNDTIVFDLESKSWSELKSPNDKAGPQIAQHCAIALGKILYVVGGHIMGAREVQNDLWTLNLETGEWDCMGELGNDLPPYEHLTCAAIDRLRVMFFGTTAFSGLMNRFHILDVSEFEWSTKDHTTSKCASVRHGFTSTRVLRKIFVFGGKDAKGNLLDDLWCVDSRDLSWSREYPKGVGPSPRWLHSAAFVDGVFFVFGGIGEDGEKRHDLYGLELSSMTWKLYDTGHPAPEPRATHTAMSFKNFKFFVCGGGEKSMLDVFQSEPFVRSSRSRSNSVEGDEGSASTDAPADRRSQLKKGGGEGATVSTADLLSMKGSAAAQAPAPAVTASESLDHIRRGGKRKSSDPAAGSSSNGLDERSPRKKSGGSRLSESTRESSSSRINSVSGPVASSSRRGTLAASSATKTTTKQLEEHLEHLEEFSSHLSDEVNQFIQMIEKFMADPAAGSEVAAAEDEEEPGPSLKDQVAAKGAALMMYAVTSKPASIVTSAAASKEKEERYPIPMKYFDQLQLPNPRKRTAEEIGGGTTAFMGLDKNMKARCNIINEIMSTETEYLRDLGVIVGLYMRPMQYDFEEQLNVSQYDMNAMFKNVESLLSITNRFLKELEAQETKEDLSQQLIGEAFLSISSDLRAYVIYSANQVAANETVSRLLKENAEFSKFLDAVKAKEECKKQALDSFLIKPFQRVCRYPLLLKELLKATPEDWPDHAKIKEAMDKIGVIVKEANSSKQTTDNLMELMDIQQKFVIGPGDTVLMQMHKYKLLAEKHGMKALTENGKKKHSSVSVYVFDEVIIIAKAKGKNKLIALSKIKKSKCVAMIPGDDSKIKNGLRLSEGPGSVQCTLLFSSPDERNEFLAKATA
mmetsp:Transcript_13928/g.54968  ORF Transcript_13928/g.54968 Transcript_13928/m.54968 type:complete len:1140 (+) Transcript_13928:94-3513(+)|eukprot:CAMPEP_0114618266 /NCGR_PEP_ID=MMETSP0168-20121206/7616_1 /TAXON_ID=95228 ORGANISM="Vannella sp., Strain DIVA3 517/6/12" /NCGR_SAMPLE_ID=MMETSP0168 /ASSEMBLY_ACC=CAM_ASM_000044 /LENGTH=1139 /DNA_ID=CAMNT_0001829411 /DNA_START=51 /DNA_END=3470 /DNA_ORIENTATION=-